MFQQGKFPSVLKKSVITPIFKQGDRTNVSNYRPISLISNIAKIIEKCIKVRLLEHLNKFKIIAPSQFGFREGLSTVDAMYALTTKLHQSINEHQKPLAIFLDLAKAFDTVSHAKLIQKLNSYGIRGICGDLLRDYLSNRKQVVSINSVLSEEASITFGIPQGTVIGPILFLLYINDMLKLNIPGQIISYADDTALVFSDSTWEGVKKKAEVGLHEVAKWLKQNKLTLNKSKSKFLTFSLRNLGDSKIKKLKLHQCINANICNNCHSYINDNDTLLTDIHCI